MATRIEVSASKWRHLVIAVPLITLLLVVNGLAQQRSKSKDRKRADSVARKSSSGRNSKAKRKSKKRRTAFRLTAETERVALSFVRKHHRELEELLVYLKENKRQAYHRAIRDLWRASDRLAGIKKRDQKRYKLELRIWQTDSRSKVLAARYLMTQKESIRNELRDVLKERAELKRKSIALEKVRLTKRMERLRSQLDRVSKQMKKLEDNIDNDVKRRFRLLTQQRQRRVTRNVARKKPKKTKKNNSKIPE